jgi:hypothetical protein
MLKLDIAKSFDSVSSGLLFEILCKLGFDQKFCEWIAILLPTASTKVMLNSEPDHPFGIGGA